MKLIFLAAKVSFKKEITIVLCTLAFILFLPLISVVVIANAGVSVVSSALAAVNPVTHIVSIFDSKGERVAEIQATTAWPSTGVVTTEFGESTPYQKHHTGTDIGGKAGDPITPFMEGTILNVVDNPDNATGYGKYVIVSHISGVTSLYAHMTRTNATFGQTVKPGDVIGYQGTTGHSTGIHLHFEIRVSGIPVNPRTFMVGDPAGSH